MTTRTPPISEREKIKRQLEAAAGGSVSYDPSADYGEATPFLTKAYEAGISSGSEEAFAELIEQMQDPIYDLGYGDGRLGDHDAGLLKEAYLLGVSASPNK